MCYQHVFVTDGLKVAPSPSPVLVIETQLMDNELIQGMSAVLNTAGWHKGLYFLWHLCVCITDQRVVHVQVKEPFHPLMR